jgi:peptidoglycan/xylan/chitin deacetylase (PgdA/CDA1 family)
MKAIKLAVGVTPKYWRPPYGNTDDRIRAIANALGLQTVMWQTDSNDWQVGSTNVTPQQVDSNYQSLIQNAENGAFDSVSLQGWIGAPLIDFIAVGLIYSTVQLC